MCTSAITLDDIEFFHSANVYFCFRHASITDGAFVAESGRSIHGSSSSVLGEAAQYRIEGEGNVALRAGLFEEQRSQRRDLARFHLSQTGFDLFRERATLLVARYHYRACYRDEEAF